MLSHNKRFYATVLFIFAAFVAFPKSFNKGKPDGHEADAYSIMPFERDPRISDWFETIHKTIDFPYNKYFEGLRNPPHQRFSWGNYGHRLFFHWGFNGNPWSPQLQECVDKCRWNAQTVALFKKKLVNEQARRNRLVMEKTSQVLNLGMSGQLRTYTNGFASLVYDAHILGDYTTTRQAPLQEINAVIDDIKSALFTKMQGGDQAKRINKTLDQYKIRYTDKKQRAQKVLELLQTEVPRLILTANNGYFRKHFETVGLKLRRV
jgi:hypothetical protein